MLKFKFGRGYVEDSSTIPRYSRMGDNQERRVFIIPVGNIPYEDINEYIRSFLPSPNDNQNVYIDALPDGYWQAD